MDSPISRSVTRAKTMEVAPNGAGGYRFTARLTDSAAGGNFDGDTATIHDFGLTGEVEGPDFTVVALDVQAYAHPYAECPFVIPATRQLIGVPLMSGWRRAVLQQGAGTAGCTHVNTLLLGLGELSTMIFFLKINADVPYGRPSLADGRWTIGALDVAPRLAGICHGLREGGTALEAARERLDRPSH
jgi:Protein of unknown function (DUF2889)